MAFNDSISKKLASGFENFGDALFGSGPEAYMKGGLMRSRIGANEALTRHRGLQSRDLDTAYGHKESLLAELLAQSQQQDAGPAARMKYNALRSGEGMTDYTTAGINTANFASKLKAIEEMKTAVGPDGQPLFDPRTLLGLRSGQSGSDASLMSQRLAKTPHEVNALEQALSQSKQMHGQKLGTEAGRANLLNAQTENILMSLNLTEEKLEGITQKNIDDHKIATQNFSNSVATGNQRQAATDLAILNQQLAGNKMDRQDAVSEEYQRIMKKWKADPNTPLNPYESYIANSGIAGSKVTGTDLTKALTRGVDVKLAGKKVELTESKINHIKKKIEKLGFDIDKTKALTELYEARERDIKAGKVNGNISFTQAGALYRELMGKRHRNDAGKRVRWEDLTVTEQRRLYNEGIDAIRSGATGMSGDSSTGSTLGDKLGDTSDQSGAPASGGSTKSRADIMNNFTQSR